jgi:myo-inositol-1(or 4)-monophosphatase
LPHRAFLEHLLRRAGDVALQSFRATTPRSKADGSQVTDADRAAEEIIVEGLSGEYPQMGIVGEEGTRTTGAEGTWYVDPIDGTSAFVEGLAHWGPTVCLVREGQIEVGAFHLPRLGETWYAARRLGAFRDDKRLLPIGPEKIQHNDSLYLPSRFHRRAPIPWPGKVRGLGSTAAHLAHTAAGGAAATLVARWALWDVGCGILLVREAHRDLVDLTGGVFDPIDQPGQPFLAGAPAAIRLLSEVTSSRLKRES